MNWLHVFIEPLKKKREGRRDGEGTLFAMKAGGVAKEAILKGIAYFRVV